MENECDAVSDALRADIRRTIPERISDKGHLHFLFHA